MLAHSTSEFSKKETRGLAAWVIQFDLFPSEQAIFVCSSFDRAINAVAPLCRGLGPRTRFIRLPFLVPGRYFCARTPPLHACVTISLNQRREFIPWAITQNRGTGIVVDLSDSVWVRRYDVSARM